MKKIVALIFLICFFTFSAHSQIYIDNAGNIHDQSNSGALNEGRSSRTYSNKKYYSSNKRTGFDKSKLVFGGGMGLQFGDYTVVNISPQVGYAFSKYITAGAGLGYTYYKDKYYIGYTKYNDKSSYVSFNLYGDLYPIQYIVFSVQPEISRMWQSLDTPSGKNDNNEFVPAFLVGGGIRFSGMTARILYDIVQDDNSPYGDGIFYSVGYTFSF